MVDLMNNRPGRYHDLPRQRTGWTWMIRRYYENDPFAPQGLPEIAAGQSPAVRILSGWHQVQRLLSLSDLRRMAIPYESAPLRDAGEPAPGRMGGSSSVFDAEGIAKGSERVERFDFVPHWHPFDREHAAAGPSRNHAVGANPF